MKTLILFLLIILINVYPQNWPTKGGNNQRNGLTKLSGPSDVTTPYWTVPAGNSLWGNSVFTCGDNFVTSRVVFTPVYSAFIEMRKLSDGGLIWEKVLTDTSILYPVGFDDFAVYAHDYKTGLLYSLSPEDGSVNWVIAEDMFGAKSGILFSCIGDPIIKGKKLDRYTGEVIWHYNYTIPVGPDAGYAMYGNTYYHWSGGITTPKKVFALNTENGLLKYETTELPGDGDQEYPLTIGADGTIYIARDGGLLYAIEDNGSALNIKWTYQPITEVKGYFGSDSSGNIYIIDDGRVIHLDKENGNVLNTSLIVFTTGFLPSITVDGEGKVYVGTADAAGKYYCLSSDLQTLYWELSMVNNYYSGPSIGKEGVMVMIGAGNQITAYKSDDTFKPVADIYAERRTIIQSNTINFFDRSSYAPENFEWHFEGGTPSVSFDRNPEEILYHEEGIYSVKLITTNAYGSDSVLYECFIEVHTMVGVEDFTNRPEEFSLTQNYPNPFNPSTKIKYTIPDNMNGMYTTLKIYDILGNETALLVNEVKAPGNYEIEYNASALSSGIYFYELRSGKLSITKKMLLIK